MMIDTSLGPIDTAKLERRVQHVDNAHETTQRIEYWFAGVCVRSDAHVVLKRGLGIEAIFGPQKEQRT